MKQVAFFCSAILLLLNSCNYTTGSGKIVTERRTVGQFTSLSASNGFDVEVKVGPVQELTVEADDNLMRYIRTEVSGSTLKIKTENLHNLSNAHLKVYITTPELKSITASSSADVKVLDLLKGTGTLNFNASSGAEIEAEVDAPEVNAGSSSGGTVRLSGKTRNYKAESSSGASIKTNDLLAENTNVSVSSGGSADVYASVSLVAEASSGGDINYHGAASVKQSSSSGGSINKKD
jgi:hypothetical protein